MRLHSPLVYVLAPLLLFVAPPAAAGHVDPDDVQWACGFGGTPGEDCGIDAIQDPSFTTTSWIKGDDKVIGLKIGGDARAYAVKMLDNHEVVTDDVGGMRVAVTWCPLCGSAVVYDRVATLDGERRELRFDVSGYLYKHDLVMYDKATDTLWTQIDGTPIGTWSGDRVKASHPAAELTVVSSEVTTWRDWRERNPGTNLLSNEGRSYGGAYEGYEDSCRFGVSGRSNCNVTGLHPKEQMVGVELGGAAKAFPIFAVREEGGVVVAPVGERTVVVATNRGGAMWVYDAGGHAFARQVDRWLDERGDAWDLAQGRSADGRAQLDPLDHIVVYWFAWKTHHPETELWLPDETDGAKPLRAEGFELPAVGGWSVILAVVAVPLAYAGLRSRRRLPRR